MGRINAQQAIISSIYDLAGHNANRRVNAREAYDRVNAAMPMQWEQFNDELVDMADREVTNTLGAVALNEAGVAMAEQVQPQWQILAANLNPPPAGVMPIPPDEGDRGR